MGKQAYFSEDFYYNYEDESFYKEHILIKTLLTRDAQMFEYLLSNMDRPNKFDDICNFVDGMDITPNPQKSLKDSVSRIKRFNNIKDISEEMQVRFHDLIDEFIKPAYGIGYRTYSDKVTIVDDNSSSEDPSGEVIFTEESYYSNNINSNNFPIYPSSMITIDGFKQYGTYYERINSLKTLDTIMNSYDDQQRIAIIGGMGGVGKTELAQAYAYNHFELNSEALNANKVYSNEFFIIFKNDVETLTKDITSVLSTCIPKKTLIIVDNLNVGIEKGFDSIIDTILSLSQGADIIITTRNTVVSSHYISSFINLTDNANIEECINIFKNNYEQKNAFTNHFTLSDEEKSLLSEIFSIVGNNILFSKLLAIQARENNGFFSIKEYYNIIANRISNIKVAFESGVSIDTNEFEYNGYGSANNPYNILKEILFNNQLTKSDFSDNDIKVLYYLSIIAPFQIEMNDLCDHIGLSRIEFKSIHNRLVKQGWINFRIFTDNNAQQYYYDIHPLLAQLFLDNINELVDSDIFNNINNSLLYGILSLEYEFLIAERYVLFYLLEKCSDPDLKYKANIIYNMIFIRKDVTQKIQYLNYRIKNAIPFIEYDESYIRYAFYDLVKKKIIDIIIIDILPSHTPITPDITLLKPFLNGRKIDINIPDKINNKKITDIPDYWLMNYRKHFKIKFPNELKRIGYKSFYNCNISGKLQLPASIKFIDDEAFGNCGRLFGKLELPNSLEHIGDACFSNCWRLSQVSLSNSLNNISQYTFNGCFLITSVFIPEGIKIISENAFAGCANIRGKLILPSSIEEIKEDAFFHCDSITEVVQDNSNAKIDENAFRSCRQLIAMSGNSHPPTYSEEFVDELLGRTEEKKKTRELAHQYQNDEHTESLIIPDGSTTIKAGLFTQNTRLYDSLSIPESVNIIEDYAFWGCENIHGNIVFPQTLTYIGEGAFNRCKQLSGDLIIPPAITRIENYTFNGCIGINGQLKLPVNLSYIGDHAFSNTRVTGFLVIPPGVDYIGAYAFHFCQNISGFLILPAGIKQIKENSFESCSKLTSVFFPSELEIIEEAAFKNCINLKGKLSFPDSLKRLYYEAFSGCRFEGEIIFPNKFEYIDGHALDYTHIDSIVFLNAHTQFPDDYIITPHRNVTIKGYKFSTAETYASLFGYKFEYLD